MTASVADQQAEFDSAFDEAALPPAKINPAASLPYYPSQRYADKNLAPETKYTYGDVEALGRAAQLAETHGILPAGSGPRLAAHAMTEGLPGNYGVNPNQIAARSGTVKQFKNMGVSVTDLTDPAEQERRRYDSVEHDPQTNTPTYYRHSTVEEPVGPVTGIVGGRFQGPSAATQQRMVKTPYTVPAMGDAVIRSIPGRGRMLEYGGATDPDVSARLAVLTLAEKQRVATRAGDSSLDAASRLYNPGMPSYLNRVKAAETMFSHKLNAPWRQFFNEHYLPKVEPK